MLYFMLPITFRDGAREESCITLTLLWEDDVVVRHPRTMGIISSI